MESVQVAVRMRPMVYSEIDRGCQEVVAKTPGEPQIVLNNESFTFNFVFDANDSQDKLYEEAVQPMLGQLFNGYNATILAYGQTGSGKTYTMGTSYDGVLNQNTGVIPRAMCDIFEKAQQLCEECDFKISCSFLELYQEQLYDLLSARSRDQSVVEIREDKNGICIPDLTHEIVQTARETTNCLIRGSTGRAVASTAMNEVSSRSHAIFTVNIQTTKKDEMRTVTNAKFHLVDLAGSERSKKTQATGDRFKEGVKINQGLLALGNVISALGSGKGAGFVRYRDSKLTRLLQDSLGGNSITLMIACISPADYNISETLSTLRYADRARKIKNKPVVNQDPHAAEINHLKSVILKLRLQLASSIEEGTSGLEKLGPLVPPSPKRVCNDKIFRDMQEKYRNVQQQLQKTLHDLVENEMRAHIAEAAHEKLKIKTAELKNVAVSLSNDINGDDEKVTALLQMVIGIDEELEKTVSEINDHKQQIALSTGPDSDGETELSEEGGAEIEKEADLYNNKQFNFKEQLSRINHELNLKEQLQQRIAGNLSKFCTMDSSLDNKFDEFQNKIRDLENEKSELLDKLSHVKENASAKLAEERRKRLQALEQEIIEMKSKIKQQSNLLKIREKEAQKILNLSREIQLMKESRVKLIRSMRQEAENFRQWKLTREKELMQMKNKGRKMENEMARKEALHSKQRNVLKRKCEEAMAINKRLKDALERQSAAQAMRQKTQSAKDNNAKRMEQVAALVERELEVITSLVDAEQTLEHLMEDRGIINRRLNELRGMGTASTEELNELEEEYEIRNAQITEIQQKVCAADLDSRIRTLCESVQNMAEARSTLKQLVTTVCDMRREYATRSQEQKLALDEQAAHHQLAEEQLEQARKRIQILEKEHKESLSAIERTYEEKIALLLSEINKVAPPIGEKDEKMAKLTPVQMECLQIQNDLFNKMESMREEIEEKTKIIENLQRGKKPETLPKIKNLVRLKAEECVEIYSTEEEEIDFDNETDDPDWTSGIKTKKHQRSRLSERKNSSLNSEKSQTADETFTTAISHIDGKENNEGKKSQTKPKCYCRSNCSTNKCGCRSISRKCDSKCKCKGSCANGVVIEDNSMDADHEGNENSMGVRTSYKSSPENAVDNSNVSHLKNNVDAVKMKWQKCLVTSPEGTLKPLGEVNGNVDENARRIARLTAISFDTPTSKKKFFD